MTPKLYTIVAVPSTCEDEVPYAYDENGFVRWVDEVFLEGYKHENAPMPDIDEAVEIVEGYGYEVEVSDDS